MNSLALQALGTQADSVHLIGHYQYMIPQLPVARVRVGLMPVAWVLQSDELLEECPPAKCCPSVTTVLTRCLQWHSTKLFVREELDTLGGPNCSSNICTSGWRLHSAVAAMVPTTPWGHVGGCGVPCAHHATKCLSSGGLFWTMGAMFNVIFQQGSCTATRCYPKMRSPNLEWRCPTRSAVPRLSACFPIMVVALLWLLPRSELGLQCQYPSRAPWYSASRCVFDLAC